MTFGVEDNSPKHSKNCKIDFLILSEGATDDTNDSAGYSWK